MKRKISKSNAGMTLVEIMIATGVLGMALAMMFGSLITISTLGRLTEDRFEATVAVSSVLEELHGMTKEDLLEYIPPELSSGPGARRNIVAKVFDENGQEYWLPQVSQNPDGFTSTATPPALPNPAEVRVVLVWEDDMGHRFNVQSSTKVGF